MTRTTLTRFFSLLMMVVVVMAAVPAFAQEALPLPAAPAGESISNPNFVLLVARTRQSLRPSETHAGR